MLEAESELKLMELKNRKLKNTLSALQVILLSLLQFYLAAVLRIRDGFPRIRIRPLLHPGSGYRIRGVKKHRIPDPTVHKNRDEK
jgi:hypothetical protein